MCSCSECCVFLRIVQNQHQIVLLSHSFVVLLENTVCVQITPNTVVRHFQEIQRQKTHHVYLSGLINAAVRDFPGHFKKAKTNPLVCESKAFLFLLFSFYKTILK